ncbi:unnamed protein product [Penicillium bialowiezense]
MASNSISFKGTNSGVQVGINHGPIYPSIERPETPPAPHSTCPFRRDPDFVDRGTLLEEIYQKGCAPTARIALVGLGGVGKSQLAIECCYRIEERSPETWVFWIHAANAERFEKSCWDIANRVKIPGRNDPKAKVFQLVHTWLSDKRNGKWVVILDNVDDSRFLHETQADQDGQEGRGTIAGGSLLESLPVTSSGSIIITSRSRDAVGRIVEPSDMIAIGPMNESDAAELFVKKLGEPLTEDANKLIRELDFMPLAIGQAAAHIRHRAPRLTVSQYLREFQLSDRERVRLLNHEKEQLRRDKEAKNSILVTWQISFDHIRQINPAAADVLSLMCLFDRQGISETLLQSYKQEMDDDQNTDSEKSSGIYSIRHNSPSPLKEDASIPTPKATSIVDLDSDLLSAHSTGDEFERSILTLRDFSLISIDADDATFEMHRLVQLAMRQWLEFHGQLEKWKECFTYILLLKFSTGRYGDWDIRHLLLPHVLSAVEQPPIKRRNLGEWAQLVHTVAQFTLDKGDYARSQKLATLAFNTRTSLFGSQDLRTIRSLALVGRATDELGNWKNAENLYNQVIEAYTRKFGARSPHTLSALNNLGMLYLQQGRGKEAEEIQLQGLEDYKRILGPDHPETLLSMSNLALIYSERGRYDEAEELGEYVVEKRKQSLGPEHPETLASMSNLAATYRQQGRYYEAEKLDIQVLKDHKRILGLEHPDTLASIRELAATYWVQGRWNEAEELEVQVLKDQKRILGPEHPDTLISMSNLATTYWRQKRLKEAEELEVQVLKSRTRILGPEHPDTLAITESLALNYWIQNRFKEAEELQVQLLKDRKRIQGPEHPDTLKCMHNHAHTLWLSDQHDSAIRLNAECVRLRTRVLGPAHYDTLSAARDLNKWREIYKISCTEDTGSLPEASGEALPESSSQDKQQESQYTISQEDHQPGWRRKRAMFSRLFRRS